jgi:N-acetylneuraminate synthase
MEDFSRRVEDIASIYSTDTIFILGKGPSADKVDEADLSGSLVIGINDAERIFPTDISIFHAEWVPDALRRSGLRSRLYVAPFRFDAGSKEVVVAPYVPLTQDTTDIMMQRFQSEEFVIEDVMFLSALKIARLVAKARGRPQKVYMVGFDFDVQLGYSKAMGGDPAFGAHDAIRVNMQEFVFLNALYVLRESLLEVLHVGSKPYSQLGADELNALFRPRKTQPRPGRHAVNVVAELTTNHFGDRHRLERMIRAAAAAGADSVKLQKRDVETFYTPEQLSSPYVSPFGKTFADYRHQLELDRSDFEFVDALCREVGVDWFASVLDEPSFDWIRQFEPETIKLPSTISEHKDYLRRVASEYSGSIVLSTGMTDKAYEDWVLATFSRCDRLVLMQCNSAYPTPMQDCNIAVVRHYNTLSGTHPFVVPGYSSHDIGHLPSALAVAAGARMVEKHVKLGNTDWAHFDAVAVDLTTSAFRDYVDSIREAELIVGSEHKQVNASEHHKYWLPEPATQPSEAKPETPSEAGP